MARSTIYINNNKQIKGGKNSFKAPMTKTTATKSTDQCPSVENEAPIMAVHPGTQERLSVLSHFAETSCKIADGPKRH